MVKNFIPTCDLCGREMSLEEKTRRNVRPDGVEILMVALENTDPELEFTQRPDGTIDLDTCPDCYARMAFRYSQAIN